MNHYYIFTTHRRRGNEPRRRCVINGSQLPPSLDGGN
jgi:hypothetical protein